MGRVAYRRLHLPTSVEFTGDAEPPDYGAGLEALLLRAVSRAIEQDDRDAGIAGPRPGWPPAGDETAAGAPTESTPTGRAHLTFRHGRRRGGRGRGRRRGGRHGKMGSRGRAVPGRARAGPPRAEPRGRRAEDPGTGRDPRG
ncbi:hypothetical protein LV779_25620 [Streptomyces thinghirensis]|nr:hypothetical protein [Streptomyces thinghirensis]